MKKHVDAFEYNAEEFEDWWKESINKMVKRAKKRKSQEEMPVFPAQGHSSRKFGHRRPRHMEIAGQFSFSQICRKKLMTIAAYLSKSGKS